ncbi:hypothetical protein GALMADRAFT_1158652 [Galerina marginata CBS 339.88]|uniref:Uncharacterized protein n=1 Tax=Galerina marginata (strain CBS 339.88) TaxID=685588 RepID=A0A067SHY0_GALM3|nr:hypothetical protein GALMADRAFT_1158652 [Galerina marginata CBS 339.88]
MLALNAYSLITPSPIARENGVIEFHVLALVTDLVVTCAFSLALQNLKANAFSPGMMAVLRRLLVFVATRGILLTALQAAHLALLLAESQNVLLGLSMHLTLDPVNILTMLVMLNSRDKLRESAENVEISAIDFMASRFTPA